MSVYICITFISRIENTGLVKYKEGEAGRFYLHAKQKNVYSLTSSWLMYSPDTLDSNLGSSKSKPVSYGVHFTVVFTYVPHANFSTTRSIGTD